MSCNEIKKQIHQALNGEISPELFAAHLESCADCRAYYKRMLKQQKMLAELSPKDAPQFDLLAAKRRKKAQTTITLRRLSAAAAVFIAVIITSSLILFPRGGSDLAETEGGMLFDQVMEAPAADAPAADEPAADAPAADAPMDEPAATAPADDTMCYAPEGPMEEPETEEAYALSISLPQDEYDKLQKALEEKGFHPEPDEFGFYIHPDHDTMDTLSEILLPYLNQELTPEISEIFISKY